MGTLYSGIYLFYENPTALCDTDQEQRELVFDTTSGLLRYKDSSDVIHYIGAPTTTYWSPEASGIYYNIDSASNINLLDASGFDHVRIGPGDVATASGLILGLGTTYTTDHGTKENALIGVDRNSNSRIWLCGAQGIIMSDYNGEGIELLTHNSSNGLVADGTDGPITINAGTDITLESATGGAKITTNGDISGIADGHVYLTAGAALTTGGMYLNADGFQLNIGATDNKLHVENSKISGHATDDVVLIADDDMELRANGGDMDLRAPTSIYSLVGSTYVQIQDGVMSIGTDGTYVNSAITSWSVDVDNGDTKLTMDSTDISGYADGDIILDPAGTTEIKSDAHVTGDLTVDGSISYGSSSFQDVVVSGDIEVTSGVWVGTTEGAWGHGGRVNIDSIGASSRHIAMMPPGGSNAWFLGVNSSNELIYYQNGSAALLNLGGNGLSLGTAGATATAALDINFNSATVARFDNTNSQGSGIYSESEKSQIYLVHRYTPAAYAKFNVTDAGLLELTPASGMSIFNLPRSDPGVSGKLWDDDGTLKISHG